MAKTVERLKFERLPEGGERVVNAKPSEPSKAAEARRVMDTACARCHKAIGRAVFVSVVGCVNGPQLFHRTCVSV